MEDLSNIFTPPILVTCAHSLSILACLILIVHYLKSPVKALDLKMITVLGVSEFIFHITVLVNIWDEYIEIDIEEIRSKISVASMNFSLYWICTMGFVLLKSVSLENMVHSEEFSKKFIRLLFIPVALSVL